jgi:Flp pilus assembly pilin Flp
VRVHGARPATALHICEQAFAVAGVVQDMTLTDERGQTLAEYGIVLAVITVAIVLVIGTLSGQIVVLVGRVADLLG